MALDGTDLKAESGSTCLILEQTPFTCFDVSGVCSRGRSEATSGRRTGCHLHPWPAAVGAPAAEDADEGVGAAPERAVLEGPEVGGRRAFEVVVAGRAALEERGAAAGRLHH